MMTRLVPGVAWPGFAPAPARATPRRQKGLSQKLTVQEQTLWDWIAEHPDAILSDIAEGIARSTHHAGNLLLVAYRKGFVTRKKVLTDDVKANHRDWVWAYRVTE